jgi:hypothetical protein
MKYHFQYNLSKFLRQREQQRVEHIYHQKGRMDFFKVKLECN